MADTSDLTAEFLTSELRELIAEGRDGKIDLGELQDRLDEYKIGSVHRIYCICRAFHLEFAEGKEIQIIRDYGSTKVWADAISQGIDEIDFDNLD